MRQRSSTSFYYIWLKNSWRFYRKSTHNFKVRLTIRITYFKVYFCTLYTLLFTINNKESWEESFFCAGRVGMGSVDEKVWSTISGLGSEYWSSLVIILEPDPGFISDITRISYTWDTFYRELVFYCLVINPLCFSPALTSPLRHSWTRSMPLKDFRRNVI